MTQKELDALKHSIICWRAALAKAEEYYKSHNDPVTLKLINSYKVTLERKSNLWKKENRLLQQVYIDDKT